MDNFVGFKWFAYLVKNEATRNDTFRVMKNTLGMSGLGIATSWVSMAFAVFLNEIKTVNIGGLSRLLLRSPTLSAGFLYLQWHYPFSLRMVL